MPPHDDLEGLPPDLQAAARRNDNGEIEWPLDHARAAVNALAHAGQVVWGLDLREYDAEGAFVETPWSSFTGAGDAELARRAANAALDRVETLDPLPSASTTTVLVTWR